MLYDSISIPSPKRWDIPFGPEMTEGDVDRLLTIEPFVSMRIANLRTLLLNDTRVVRFQRGDIVIREGDYGNCAFLVLTGTVRVVLDALPPSVLGRREKQHVGFFSAIARLWRNPSLPEVRDLTTYRDDDRLGTRRSGEDVTRVFLQDIPGVLKDRKCAYIAQGEIFGEQAAMSRTPRTATVVADGMVELLELPWQALRDMRRQDPRFREYIDKIYRERSLGFLLRETELFRHLDEASLMKVRDAVQFETYGEMDWYAQYRKVLEEGSSKRLALEPIIAEEGSPVNGLLLFRSGFVRVSVRHGHGHQTVAYRGKGQSYGMAEIAHNWRRPDAAVPMRRTLRAVGYVDVLRVPTPIVEEFILKRKPAEEVEHWAREAEPAPEEVASKRERVPTGMLEFLVENRRINGTATMIIDLDRCTRCDMCVRACADGHDGNPRFLRAGPRYGSFQFPSACMHCADPVCMIGCPTGAISREKLGGEVAINDRTCIGCTMCANNCPYHAIRMVPIRDEEGRPVIGEKTGQEIKKATSCDLCMDLPGGPACQRACPHDALVRADMRDIDGLAKWVNR